MRIRQLAYAVAAVVAFAGAGWGPEKLRLGT